MRKKGKDDLDDALIAGFADMARAYRSLLWEQARKHDLSPLQVQLILYIQEKREVSVSSLATCFALSKATVSEAIKSLESKNMIGKHKDPADARSAVIRLTEWGTDIAHIASFYTEPVRRILAPVAVTEKEILLKNINGLLRRLQPGPE